MGGGIHVSRKVDRASPERTVKNSCAYAFASSAWTWCITASFCWSPISLNEDVA